jgi:hypothetical protein
MKITKTTPSEPTGPKPTDLIDWEKEKIAKILHLLTELKLTKEIYDAVSQIKKEEGGDFAHILKTRFGIKDFNPYQHYYGFNKPID